MKIRTALLPLVLSLCLLAGCGASASGTAVNQDGVSMETGAAADVSDAAEGLGGTLDTDALSQQQTDQKIIYTAWLELESRQFDQARTQLVQALEQAGGYIESSSENGSASGSARWVSLVLRVPADQYQDFLSQAGQTGNLLRVFEDKPIYYDNWDIDIFYTEKFWDVTDLKAFTWTEQGPVRATLHIERAFSNSTIAQDIHFYAGSRRIDFVTTVDWHEHQHLLKVQFPVNVHTDEATFEIQYGNLTRKTHQNTGLDAVPVAHQHNEEHAQKGHRPAVGHLGDGLDVGCHKGQRQRGKLAHGGVGHGL